MAFKVFTETRVRNSRFISINETKAFGFSRAFLDAYGITKQHKAVIMYDEENNKIALNFTTMDTPVGFSVQMNNEKHGGIVKAKSFFEHEKINVSQYARRYHDFEQVDLKSLGIDEGGTAFVISLDRSVDEPEATVQPALIDPADQRKRVGLFEGIKRVTEGGDEFWSARDLYDLLEYTEWRAFDDLIQRAISSLREAGGDPVPHFVPGHKMAKIGQGNARPVKDYKLSRFGSYLVAMNGDPDQKPRVAEAQSYFAQKTRLQELNEAYQQSTERLREWSKYDESDRQLNDAITEAGISERGLNQIRGGGDKEFFGGLDELDMRNLYGLKDGEALSERMPTVVLSAKSLTNQMTQWKIENRGLYGVDAINEEHVKHSRLNRQTLVDEGMVPEELPGEGESIKEIRDATHKQVNDLLS